MHIYEEMTLLRVFMTVATAVLWLSSVCNANVPDCIGESSHIFAGTPFANLIRASTNDADLREFRAYFNAFENNRTVDAMNHLRKVKIRNVFKRSFNRSVTSIPEIIKGHGYPVEVYNVVTKDGYVLSLYRIPGSKGSPPKNRIPVLLLHGLFESSNAWVVLGPEKSLAFLLVEAGYDVWLSNARGTHDSRQHKWLSSIGKQKKEYWTFSWHEIGVYDLPATIDFILEKTKHKRLHYIGHSQGTTAFLVMASEMPAYNDKIILFTALAPVAYLKNIRSQLHRIFYQWYRPIKWAFDWFSIYDIDVNNEVLVQISQAACLQTLQSATSRLCRSILYVIASNQLNCSTIPLILEHAPNGVSVRQLFHFIQLMRSDDFKKFDYDDERKNEEIYGQKIPPLYNLTQVTAPTCFHYSLGDETATDDNARMLKSRLPNVIGSYVVPREDFAHIDFVYSTYVRKLLNENIINVMKKTERASQQQLNESV